MKDDGQQEDLKNSAAEEFFNFSLNPHFPWLLFSYVNSFRFHPYIKML